jgi:hypothetical protein
MKHADRLPYRRGNLVSLTTLIEPDQREALEDIARREHRTVGDALRCVLREYFAVRQGQGEAV